MNNFTKEEFWKNFNIGREVQLAGNFIYDGLLIFDKMESFYNEDEIFEFLYFISVGIERLIKADIILIEHSNEINQDEFENSLRSHNHSELIKRINKSHELNLGKVHNEFIQILSKFYKSCRYDRFGLDDFENSNKEKSILINFINKYLEINISNEFLSVTPNDKRIKSFIGRTIKKIVDSLYEVVRIESRKLNIYTYEVRTFSKAYKIFLEKDFTFEREKILQKEVLIHLLKNSEDSGFKKHISDHLPPLEFDNYLENTYSKCLFDLTKCSEFLDELEHLYEEQENKKFRFEALDVIGSDIHFTKDIEDETNEFDV